MKTYIRFCLALILAILLIASTALADTTCSYSFTSQGKIYNATHHIKNGDVYNSYYTVPNPVRDTDIGFDHPSQAYLIYNQDASNAWWRHLATCPYNHNLGDERVPMALIYGGAALAVVAILVVHKKRKSLRAAN